MSRQFTQASPQESPVKYLKIKQWSKRTSQVNMKFQPQEDCVTSLVADILACYLQLSQLPNLRPSPQVNHLFEDLVHLCCYSLDEDITTKASVEANSELRKSKRGYGAFPGLWGLIMGHHLTKSPAKVMLQNFTYHDNYMDLIRMELNALDSVTRGARPRKFAVLGSGPLPMTSLCISQSLNSDEDAVVVHNVDRDAWAISKSTALCRRLGYRPEQVGFHCADVEVQAFDLRGFDVVYLAGLVGTTNEQKQNIIAGIVEQMSPGRPQRQSNFGGPEAIVDRPPMQPYHQLRGNLPDRTDETRSLHTAGVDEETNPRLTSRESQACGLVNRIQTSAQPLMHLAGNSSSGYYVFVE
ncbi:MAG: hypothetical protein Q9186_001394 [Xanthomendoza sp. 1 TL-2023]